MSISPCHCGILCYLFFLLAYIHFAVHSLNKYSLMLFSHYLYDYLGVTGLNWKLRTEFCEALVVVVHRLWMHQVTCIQHSLSSGLFSSFCNVHLAVNIQISRKICDGAKSSLQTLWVGALEVAADHIACRYKPSVCWYHHEYTGKPTSQYWSGLKEFITLTWLPQFRPLLQGTYWVNPTGVHRIAAYMFFTSQ